MFLRLLLKVGSSLITFVDTPFIPPLPLTHFIRDTHFINDYDSGMATPTQPSVLVTQDLVYGQQGTGITSNKMATASSQVHPTLNSLQIKSNMRLHLTYSIHKSNKRSYSYCKMFSRLLRKMAMNRFPRVYSRYSYRHREQSYQVGLGQIFNVFVNRRKAIRTKVGEPPVKKETQLGPPIVFNHGFHSAQKIESI